MVSMEMERSLTYHYPFERVSESKNYLILFLIWPFLAFIVSIANYKEKEARRVVYFFLIYFGLCFVADNWHLDSYRYALALERASLQPFSDLFKIFSGVYGENGSIDIYEPVVTLLVSRFTTYQGVLFAVYAAVFGYFYLKSINILSGRYQDNPGLNSLIHLIFFIVILPITAINGVRMWTAAWIFFYGAINVVLYKNKRFLFIALTSVLVHWSFMSACAILILYAFLGNRNIVYLPLAIVSFILPQLLIPMFGSLSSFLGGSVQSRYEGYTSEALGLEIQELTAQTSWFMLLKDNLVFYYIILGLLVISVFYRGYMTRAGDKNLLSFLLLFLAFVNFGSNIPSFGNRFQVLFFLFGTFYLFRFFTYIPNNRLNFLTWIGLFPMLLYSVTTFRIYSETISAWLFAPGFGSPLLTSSLSLAELFFH